MTRSVSRGSSRHLLAGGLTLALAGANFAALAQTPMAPAALGGEAEAPVTPQAAFEIAKLSIPGADSASANSQRIVTLYQHAAKEGVADAQEKLAWLYSMGELVEEDAKLATYWFEQAANQGSAGAQYSLAWRYMDGEGAPVDISIARRWFELAADQGHIDAQNALGYLLHHGEAPIRNIVEAAHWYSEAARNDHMLAKGNLADLVRDRPQINIEGVLVVRDQPNSSSNVVTHTRLGDPAYTLEANREWTAVLLKDQKRVGWIKNSEM